MSTLASASRELRETYERESARIQQEFSTRGDGRSTIAARTLLVESILLRLWGEIISPHQDEPRTFALVATGGFGRGWLFPHSDIDILFLHAGSDTETKFRDAIRRFSQELWDLRLKLSPATRTLSECERFDPNNVEFAISLLDCRYLAGDRDVFSRLREKAIPRLVAREHKSLIKNLVEITRARHHKFGNTVFHLEPNIKDGPGGLRDYNVAHWLTLLSAMKTHETWPEAKSLLADSSRRALSDALDFEIAVRCFLHFRHGRHDNTLFWEAQDEAAARNIGGTPETMPDAAAWMRIYFRYAGNVHRTCTQLLDEVPGAYPSLTRQLQSWQSHISTSDFAVVDGLLFLQKSHAAMDPETVLQLFYFMAQHDVRLSTPAESAIEQALSAIASNPPQGPDLWLYLGQTLVQPHAADALRAMNALGVLSLLVPELKGIEALVVRDYYHRYTVDEHSFLAIEHLHRLKEAHSEWEQRFSELLSEVEQPELLFLSLLLHDSGKQAVGDNHLEGSLRVTEGCADRLDLDSDDRDLVRFLVANHLEMSAAARRDVFDPANVRSFAEKVGNPERLKMLCLLTYADIKAVNPEAMTPWKADNLWQLYIGCANHLARSADQRVHADDTDSNLAHLHSLAPVMGRKINNFLEGLPQRYLRIHGAAEVFAHAEMAARLRKNGVQLSLKQVRHWYELTLVTTDRPFLFASVSGVLAAWGMNIVKANAFSNADGIVVDTFYFTDRYRTLELNIPEWERFKKSIASAIKGETDVAKMLEDRFRGAKNGSKVNIETQMDFDSECSSQSTLLQIVTQDRPGLLYKVCSQISSRNCNIEIALIETEGQMAIDVFYLSSAGAKLSRECQTEIAVAIQAELGTPADR